MMATKQRVLDVIARLKALDETNRSGGLTEDEVAELHKLHAEALTMKAERDLRQLVDGGNAPVRYDPMAGRVGGTTLYHVLRSQSWEPGRKAMIPASVASGIGFKDLIDNPEDAAPFRELGIIPEVSDSRFIYPLLPSRDAGDRTQIQALVTTGRSLDADVKDVASTDTKPTTYSGTTLATFNMQRAATVSDYYPNAIIGPARVRRSLEPRPDRRLSDGGRFLRRGRDHLGRGDDG